MYMNSGAVLDNSHVFDVTADGTVLYRSAGAASKVVNSGLFVKSGGTGNSLVYNVGFDNSGTLELASGGTLTFDYSDLVNRGTVQVDGGLLDFQDGRLTSLDGAHITVAGAARVRIGSGATLELHDTTVENFDFYGTLAGNGTIQGGGFKWLGGTMDASGITTINSAATVTIEGTASKILNGRTLNNQGQINWSGATVYMNSGAVLDNSHVFDVTADGTVLYRSAGAASKVVNSGLFVKSGGTGNSFVYNVDFDNHGTVQVDSGVLQFQQATLTAGAGSRFTGPGTTVVDSSATLALQGALTADNFELYGPLTGSGTILGSGFKWLGGTMNNSGATTLDWSATMNIAGAASKTLDGRTLHNQGRINWSGATVYMNSGAVLDNSGTVDVTTDGTMLYHSAGTACRVDNSGTFLKSAGNGTSSLYYMAFNNSGTVQVNSGTLSFPAGSSYAQSAGTTRLAGGALSSSSPLNINGGRLTGAGTVSADVAMHGITAPGNSPGTLVIDGNFTMYAGARLEMEIGGRTQGSSYDYLQVKGAATLGGDLVIRFVDGFQSSITSADSFTLLSASTSLSGAFDNVANGGTLLTADGFGSFNVHYGVGPKTVVIDGFVPTPVPEPGTYLAGLSAIGMLGLFGWRKRK